MLFFSFFKTLIGYKVVVELKNDVTIEGVLYAVDQYLNLKLRDIKVRDAEKYPHLLSVRNVFLRGSVVRYVHIPKEHVDIELLQDSARLEAKQLKETAKR
jgi:U6 snRNA-associated Sm-like protein LSm2